jgi:hypothetical protein
MAISKARRNRVKELWFSIPETRRKQLMSACITFASAFALSVGASLAETGEASLETGVVAGILLAALRAAIKVVAASFFSRVLPDPKA